MSLPRYPEYKDSGVAWLGEVPGHWRLTKVKHVIPFQTGWTPPTGNAASYEGDNLWANISDLGEKWINDTSKRISDEAVSKAQIGISPKGSLMFSFKLSIGQVSFAGQDMYTNEAIATFLPSSSVFLCYAYYAFPLFLVQNASENIYGAKLLNQELIRAANIVLPNQTEQQTIAAFLDSETGKIDALISEQQRLVELLAEKRQAVISHAVTKGLNPNVPMKDSGIEWLGAVPAHWEVCAIKRMTLLITDGAHISPETEDGIYDFVSTKDISDTGIDFEGCLKTSPSSYEYLVRTGCQPLYGDVLFSKDGTIGRTVVVKEQREFVVASSLIIIRPDSAILTPSFLHYLCQSFVVMQQVEGFVKGAGLPRLSIQNLLKVFGMFPSLAEQNAIATFLDTETAKFDALTVEANRAIALLQERRAALISAAVTGKIDVRGAVIPA